MTIILMLLLFRLLIWYSVITALIRCPSSLQDLTDDYPRVCKPYLSVRSHVAPYLEPYYNTYAAHYVDTARPYVEKLEKQVYTPVVGFSKHSYKAYGAPGVNQARAYGQTQWVKTVKPQIDIAQSYAKKHYNSALAPHIGKATAIIGPYYETGQKNMVETYNTHLLPAYTKSRPYADKAYALGHKVAIDTGLPYLQKIWRFAVVFIDRTLWPKLRVLYGKNVEPQLVRIGERLGRYRDGRKLKAAVDDVHNTSETSSLSSSLSSVASSVASAYATGQPDQSTTATSEAATPSLTAEQEAEQVQDKIGNDLRNWQEKFAKAAERGTEDLQERVKEITDRQVKAQVQGVGEALVIQLEESSNSEIAKLKRTIIKIVKSVPKQPSNGDIEPAEEELAKAIRSAGSAVKNKAQALRLWKQNYDEETRSLVNAASESTLDVIDNIRDLGLQEIGMRWAWMEGVTYKDWSKYHDMKKTFAEWRSEVETVAKDHKGVKMAQEAGDDVESRGMGTAEDTAKELSRLKEVGRWKIQTGDASEDFSTKYVPARAAAAGQKVMEKINSASEGIVGTSQGSMESVASQASQAVADAAAGISSQVIGTQPGMVEQAATRISAAVGGTSQSVHESVASVASEKATQATSKMVEAASAASEKASDVTSNAAEMASGVTSRVSEMASDAASQASEMASEASSVASEKVDGFKLKFVSTSAKVSAAVAGTQQPIGDSIISVAISKASEAIIGTEQPMTESMVSAASKKLDQAKSVASEQVIGTPAPIHESLASEVSRSLHSAASAISEVIPGSSTPLTESISSAASSVSSSASSVASKASKKVFAGAMAQRVEVREPILDDVINDDETYSEKMQSMISQAGDKYADITRAVSDALLQPTSTQGSVESITSIASEQYSSALAAASSVLYGAEQGTGEGVMGVASGKYAEAVAA